MRNNSGNRGIIIVTGVMAAGKSTVAQLLAEKFERGVHVRGDTFRRMIVSGREEMTAEETEEALRQLTLRYEIAASVADIYFNAGFNVVLQDVIIGPMLNDMVRFIKNRPLYVVVLSPSQEAVQAREDSRSKKGYGEWTVSALDHVLQSETPKIGMWLDTSDQTAEETAEDIWNNVWSKGRVFND